jgi:hypothetical protein
MVAYPNAGVFPLELLNGQEHRLVFVLLNQVRDLKTPKITVTDDDTGKTVTAKPSGQLQRVRLWQLPNGDHLLPKQAAADGRPQVHGQSR